MTEEELKRIMEEVTREKVLKGLPLPVDEKICATSGGISAASSSEQLETMKSPARRWTWEQWRRELFRPASRRCSPRWPKA
ncbi:MAG: hypothetical protein MZV64_50555 [Ignavibacteriales bacterium]|nr:hypothetical protein [Ignavibacteriales bacterium]